MGPRLQRWLRRCVPPLGFEAEHWDVPADHPAVVRLQELKGSQDLPTYHATRFLILNVIHAAGAIEYTVDKLEAAFAEEEAALDEHAPHLREPDDQSTSFSGVNRDVIQFEYSNLLFWLKALQERISTDIRDDDGRSYKGGLLKMLAPGETWTKKTSNLYGALQQQILEPDRDLANFATHASAVPHPFEATKVEEGRLALRIPDPPTRRIYVWDEFNFKQSRDALTFARSALEAVEVFVDGMLDAFEEAKREIEARRKAKLQI